jgi:uncharacterized protein (DUF58 family)
MGSGGRPLPPLRAFPVIGVIVRWYEERLTNRGRFLVWTTLLLGMMGADTRRTQIYLLFAIAMGLMIVARTAVMVLRPHARLECPLPPRATAGVPLKIHARIVPAGTASRDLCLTFPRAIKWSSSLHVVPRQTLVAVDADPVDLSVELTPTRRGRYLLRRPTIRVTDPLGLSNGNGYGSGPMEQPFLVYPRFYTLERFDVPAGRRYQPGGIPLSSSTGDAIEFVGTRDYRQGDALRTIHWRSWARRGAPVVKEYQEEYFCRIALVLDTFVPERAKPAHERRFEAAISVLASIADHYSRSEFVVDILAAGPQIYDVSTGRSLAYFDNILDVLACLEPCREPPFKDVAPPLFDRLAQITTLVAVLQDWDETRETLLRQVRARGTAVHVIVVHEGPTTSPIGDVSRDLGSIELLTPDEVERRLQIERVEPRSA